MSSLGGLMQPEQSAVEGYIPGSAYWAGFSGGFTGVLVAGLVVASGRDFQELGEELLDWGEAGRDQGCLGSGGDDGDGEVGELAEDDGAAGCGGWPVLGIERQAAQAGGGDGAAELAFEQGGGEQGGVEAEGERVYPLGAGQVDGRGAEHGLEGVVPGLDVRLALVRGQDTGGRQGPVVADEGEAAVAGGVAGGQRGVGDRGQGPAGEGEVLVCGAGAGPASGYLLAGDGVGAGDAVADPAGGSRGGDRGIGCPGDGGGGLQPAARCAQLGSQGV